MATSEVEICNSALIKVGAQRILSLNDNNERAKLLKEHYAKVRDDLLYSHPWNFAIGRSTLAADPTPPKYWSTRFLLPSDCLRVVNTDIPKPGEWRTEGRYLMANWAEVEIEYIKQITDVSKFTPGFSELLALKIASDICYSITKNATLKDGLLREYKESIRLIRSFDAQESLGDRVYADTWLNARY